MNKRNIVTTLECFIKKDGKYLMLHRNPDKKIMPDVWMAPGGKIEKNEGLFECARREVQEETGLKIKNLRVKVIGNGYLQDLDQEIFFHFVFADYAGGKVLKNPSDGELVWLTPAEIAKLPNLLAEIHEIAPRLFNDDDTIISYKVVYEKGNKMVSFAIDKP
jgi:8-oxo-dGTP diphosphatase